MKTLFSLRDRVSLTPNAYNLDEALGLEALLRAEGKGGGALCGTG